MLKSNHHEPNNEDEDYIDIEDDSNYEDFDFDSSDSELDDPTYDHRHHLDSVRSKLSQLSIKSKSKSRGRTKTDDGEFSEIEGVGPTNLDVKDAKDLEQFQKIIDGGQVEKLKVEQCKVYLRNFGLRLTGKKETLIQRIKEHIEVLHGGGERKYPPSSFVLNCRGDACMGDIVMFEQTVYEGYNIASRSASGPPCGKRIVAGRIVKESYGAAKQQHTFTVEVLWSKGDKPLPPLHPLLIKGRNLYRLNTMRQRWEDESERHRVLREKHSRGYVARSNRETRIQEKEAKKMHQRTRALPKDGQNSHKSNAILHETKNINRSKIQQQKEVTQQTQEPQTCQEPAHKVLEEFKENLYSGWPRVQPSQHSKRNMPAPCSYQEPRPQVTLRRAAPPTSQHNRSFKSTSYGDLSNSFNQNAEFSVSPRLSQQRGSTISTFHFSQEQESILASQAADLNRAIYHNSYRGIHHKEPQMSSKSWNHSRGGMQRPNHNPQQLCRYYPQGRCYYGNQCKFLHELDRNYL